MITAGERPKSGLPRLTAAQLIRIDWIGGLTAGAAMLVLSPWLAGLYAVPAAQLRGLAIVNLVYGTASFTLAARFRGGDVPCLGAMASANLLGLPAAGCCCGSGSDGRAPGALPMSPSRGSSSARLACSSGGRLADATGRMSAPGGPVSRLSFSLAALVFGVTSALAQDVRPSAPRSPWRAADGVTIDEAGDPQYSTFSLCAIDPATGQSGAAVTTRVPFVGRAVPWVRAGVGAVCTQASTVVEYGVRGLDLMAKGVDPKDAIPQLLADDQARESRQLGMIDMKGRAAAHTGKNNNAWAGSRQGRHYTVQANIMVGPEVVDAVATVFEATEGTGMPLAERMILALEAGQAKGGDSRWGNLQSAAIRVADPNDPGRANDFVALAIDVGEHAEPVGEMKRIYYTTQRRLGYRSFSHVEGPDVVELKRMLHALGYWRPSLAAFPEAPAVPNTRAMQDLRRSDPTKFDGMQAASRKAAADFNRDYAHFDAETVAAVDKFRADRKLAFSGNPPGLVDERLVAALRAAYRDKQRAAPR